MGPIPEYMMKEGRLVSNFFTKEGLIYQEPKEGEADASQASNTSNPNGSGSIKINLLIPKETSLRQRLHTDDLMFLDFVGNLLTVDPEKRMSSTEALKHPWLTESVYEEES